MTNRPRPPTRIPRRPIIEVPLSEFGDVAGRGDSEFGDAAGRGNSEFGDAAGRGDSELGDAAGREIAVAARAFGESYVPIEPVLLHAMTWATELGVVAVGPGAGAALRLLASATQAKSVVEIGTGTGVSGLWLLRGMRPDSVLTSIDVEPEYQAMAKQSFAAAGFANGRSRLISGNSRDVLPRLADDAYDLVFVDSTVSEYPHCVSAAHRILRPGAVLVVNNAFGVDSGVLDSTVDDHDTRIMRELVNYLRETPVWTTTVLPVGQGLLCASKTP